MNKQEIGNKIKKRRADLKITQVDLSEICGISSKTLRDIELGKANPRLETLMAICAVIGVSINIQSLGTNEA